MKKARAAPRTATFTSVFRSGEFRALWLAETFSTAGDQVARVALSVLVFDLTGSPGLTGLTYALTFLPALVGGGLLASLADRYPRRTVMVICDLICAALVAVMAIPGTPLLVVGAALVGVTMTGSLFRSARLALLPDLLSGEQFVLGMAIRSITLQTAQLIGFAGGGVLIAALDPYVALAVNSLTFAISAALLRFGVRHRPAAAGAAGTRPSFLRSSAEGFRLIWHDPALRACAIFSWLFGFYVIPEALAAPYAEDVGGGARAVGLLLAAMPIGTVVGNFLYTRFIADPVRSRLITALAILTGVPLLAFWFEPGLVAAVVLLALSGAFSAYQVQVVSEFTRTVPAEGRAQAVGLGSSVLLTTQGLGVLAGGMVAEWLGAADTVVVAGAAGMVASALTGITWQRVLRNRTPGG